MKRWTNLVAGGPPLSAIRWLAAMNKMPLGADEEHADVKAPAVRCVPPDNPEQFQPLKQPAFFEDELANICKRENVSLIPYFADWRRLSCPASNMAGEQPEGAR